MTGLNPDTDHILEISCIITSATLLPLPGASPGYHAIIQQPASVLARMDAWCTRTHSASGLMAASQSPDAVNAARAAEQLFAYVQQHAPVPGSAILAGNSVHADRAFLRRGPWARLIEHLHYRLLDVSSLKEAVRMWAPAVAAGVPRKRGCHTAREDVLESIEEARYYREVLFGCKPV